MIILASKVVRRATSRGEEVVEQLSACSRMICLVQFFHIVNPAAGIEQSLFEVRGTIVTRAARLRLLERPSNFLASFSLLQRKFAHSELSLRQPRNGNGPSGAVPRHVRVGYLAWTPVDVEPFAHQPDDPA